MNSLTIILLSLLCGLLHAQKQVTKTLEAKDISYLLVDAHHSYRVKLTTGDSELIRVTAQSEGEYQSVLALKLESDGATAKVAAGFQPNFRFPNDKLGAHKVVSVSLEISLPLRKNVKVFGNSSNVIASGLYQNFEVVLADGSCSLEDIQGTIRVQTQQGDIVLINATGEVDAESSYGKVDREIIPPGDNHFFLRTISGHISLFKKE
ncbi:DUF4097 family beta strand repeat-containing protein [Zeaxanthinibacter sp. PT1]|uniref:DUF4097 family beta strand repeat-containing protein n=1 Tax=Zeaxanthinibacter TaxID=561554 RepID=UPI00234A3DF8|nr:DUF4097 family beta strand repeat-containing protein [Zeaxanthinibacter sp. PT1]MDC6351003.1 DUF4097 family beta strand repeat-containing protein [Zeaxanthinibacter sp. PT1]